METRMKTLSLNGTYHLKGIIKFLMFTIILATVPGASKAQTVVSSLAELRVAVQQGLLDFDI